MESREYEYNFNPPVPGRFLEDDEDFSEGDGSDEEIDPATYRILDEPDVMVRPAKRFSSGLSPVRDLLESQNEQYGVPRRIKIAPRHLTPEPFLCAKCKETCEYTPAPTDADAKSTVAVYKRPACKCERDILKAEEDRQAIIFLEKRKFNYQKSLAIAKRALILPDRLKTCTFNNYDVDRHKSMKQAYLTARNFAEGVAAYYSAKRGFWQFIPEDLRMSDPPQACPFGYVILGKTGRGKSHLAAATLSLLSSVGVVCRFENVEDFLQGIRSEFDGAGKVGERYYHAEKADVLCLDDLGMEHYSASNPTWGRAIMYRLINARYEKGLPTIATCMLTADKLSNHYGEQGPAILSRLSLAEWLVIHPNAPDGRQRFKGNADTEATNEED